MDINLLVEKVTKEVMLALKNISTKKNITVISHQCEKNLIENFKHNLDDNFKMVKDIKEADYVLLSKEEYNKLTGQKTEMKTPLKKNTIDFVDKKVIQEKDLKMLNLDEYEEIVVNKKTIITSLAMDLIRMHSLKIIK